MINSQANGVLYKWHLKYNQKPHTDVDWNAVIIQDNAHNISWSMAEGQRHIRNADFIVLIFLI